MDVSRLAPQPFLIYTPPSAPSRPAEALTPDLWLTQMQRFTRIMETGPVAPPAGTPPTEVHPVEGRNGRVLKPDTILKADQYAGIGAKNRTRSPGSVIPGAPNYRELGEGIHGTAQPTVQGMKEILKRTGAGPGGSRHATWVNLREEPVIYINGQPYNPRHIRKPFANDAMPGRTAREVDGLEQDLKGDVLEEARRHHGTLTLADEGPDGKVIEKQVTVDKVQTIDEVYAELKAEGYRVDVKRIPITDTKKPDDADIDELVDTLKDVPPDEELIFNCHAGEGRTTTAMVLASIVRNARAGKSDNLIKDKALRDDIKEQGEHNPANYRAILTAIKEAQRAANPDQDRADEVIRRYGDIYDLKEEADKARQKAAEDSASLTPEERARRASQAADYMERYGVVVSFEAYAREQAPDFKLSYTEWKARHPEVARNLHAVQLAMAGGDSAAA